MRNTLSLLWDSLKSSICKPFQHPGVLLAISPIYALQWIVINYLMHHGQSMMAISNSLTDNPFTMPIFLIVAMRIIVFTIDSILIAIMSSIYKYPELQSLKSKFKLTLGLTFRNTLPLIALLIVISGVITIGLTPIRGEGPYTMLALAIPGLYFTTIFSLAIPAFLLEEKGVMQSLKSSYNLMKGNKIGFLLFSITMVAATTIIGFRVDFASANLIDYLDSIHSFLIIALMDLLVQSSLFIIKASIIFEFYNRLVTAEQSN